MASAIEVVAGAASYVDGKTFTELTFIKFQLPC